LEADGSNLEAPHLLRREWTRTIPLDATHIGICVDGGWALEESGLLRGTAESINGALEALATTADQFEQACAKLIAAACEAGLATVVCTLVPSRHEEESRRRVAAAALAIFNERILRQAFQAKLSIVELRPVCDEDCDYSSETLLSHAGVRKVANVAARPCTRYRANLGGPRVDF
jgi:hypothetical protein